MTSQLPACALNDLRDYLREIIEPIDEADKAYEGINRLIDRYVNGPARPPVTPESLEFCRKTLSIAKDLMARLVLHEEELEGGDKKLVRLRGELTPYLTDFVVEDWHGDKLGALKELLQVREGLDSLIQSLELHASVHTSFRAGRKGRPVNTRRQSLEIFVAHILIHHGVPVAVSRDGKFARLLTLVHDATGITSGTDLFRTVKRAVHYAKVQRRVFPKLYDDPYSRLSRLDIWADE